MMLIARRACVGACVLGLGSVSVAQTVEFRIIEMTDKAVADPSNPELNFAIQARVTSATNAYGLSSFVCAMVATGESESSGVLTKLRTSNADTTYFSGISSSTSGGGSVGMARQYSYLANLNNAFNGVINTSSGSWVQTPSQDIGLIFGAAREGTLLNIPGVDDDGNGAPDTAVGNSAQLPNAIMSDYFGAGKFIDIYRFRYRVTDFTARTINFSLLGDTTLPTPQVYVGNRATRSSSGSWLMEQEIELLLAASASQGFSVQVIPAPGVAAGVVLCGATLTLRRRRR